MTQPMTNRDARETYSSADMSGWVLDTLMLHKVPRDIQDELCAHLVQSFETTIRVTDVRALLSTEEVGGSDQPLPSVATGHPEQGALLSGWRSLGAALVGHAGGRYSWPPVGGAHPLDAEYISLHGNDWHLPTIYGAIAALSDGASSASTTDASRAPGTNNNNTAKGGE